MVDIDTGTGEVKVRRFVAIDDCGNIINPMIVEGQIHGGLTMGLAPALYEEIQYDEQGNLLQGALSTTSAHGSRNAEVGDGQHVRPRRTIPRGAKGIESRPRSGRQRRLPMPWLMPCGTWACAILISRSPR